MSKQFTCDYADCNETELPIVVTDRQGLTQDRFCCLEHAAELMFARAQRRKREQRDAA